ncbi:MAG: antibiotic biosynthesis monooxygenase [Gemmatimonadales bacterium]
MSAPSRSWSASKNGLIARIWRGVTPADRAEEYAAYLAETGARDCRATPGNRGVYVLRRVQQDRAEFTFVSLWESLNAIRRFAGDDYEKARYYPEDREFLIEREPFVEHYDVIG